MPTSADTSITTASMSDFNAASAGLFVQPTWNNDIINKFRGTGTTEVTRDKAYDPPKLRRKVCGTPSTGVPISFSEFSVFGPDDS